MQRIYIVVEGQHDVAVIGCLLRLRGLALVKNPKELDAFWTKLVPNKFPYADDLTKRVPVPAFFRSDARSVAVHSADGLDRVPDLLAASLANLSPLDALGVVLDADEEEGREGETATERWKWIVDQIKNQSPGIAPGVVGDGCPRTGVFVLPDNASPGTLEDVLLECAAKAYPKLLDLSENFVSALDPDDRTIFINRAERKDLIKPAGKKKAKLGIIGSVLRPGKSFQVSIQDNQWLRNADALALPRVADLLRFLDALLS